MKVQQKVSGMFPSESRRRHLLLHDATLYLDHPQEQQQRD